MHDAARASRPGAPDPPVVHILHYFSAKGVVPFHRVQFLAGHSCISMLYYGKRLLGQKYKNSTEEQRILSQQRCSLPPDESAQSAKNSYIP